MSSRDGTAFSDRPAQPSDRTTSSSTASPSGDCGAPAATSPSSSPASGRPYALGDVAGRAAGLVQAFMPGEEGGAAIAGVLSGRVVPGGKLPKDLLHPGSRRRRDIAPPVEHLGDCCN
ncbi:MAG TPA: glycoside hydrolase family 3 C-terminal domain-containing protein, partial [Kribbella sp.]